MMTDSELQKLAHYIVLEQASNDAWMEAHVRAEMKLRKEGNKSVRYVSPKVAAEMLGISKWQLYRIKDDENGIPRFSYIKSGHEKSSTLKFNASTLLEEYERYISSKGASGIRLAL